MKENVRGANDLKTLRHPPAQTAAVCLLLLLGLLLTGCKNSRPILVGFTAELSGRNATLGMQSRNGAALAVEEINALGGIRGRMLELVVRDNQGSPELVAALDQQLIDSGVFVLTGHNTSWESMAAKPVIDARKAILVSPTASSPIFDGRNDYFFRLIPSNREQARPLAGYAYQDLNIRRIAVLDDDDNHQFSHPYVDAFIERFAELGGEKAAGLHFSSKDKPNFRSIIEGMQATGADGLLVVASDTDTALIAQQAKLAGWEGQILATNWAYTSGLIKNGGRTVEGLILSSHFNTSCGQPSYLQFQEQYRSSYGEDPAFISAISYETVRVIGHALEATGGEREGFAEALTGVRDFEGLCGKISLNANGDAQRDLSIVQVRGSQFELVKTLSMEVAP